MVCFFPRNGAIGSRDLERALFPGILMPRNRTKFAIFLLSLSLVSVILSCVVPHLLAAKREDRNEAPSGASDQRRALHALNRLTFGPRPGDVQRVMAMGVDQWINLQLHPEKINDGALNSRLEPFRTLHMSTKEIAENFPDPQEINQVMNGKRAMPSDPARHAIYEVQVARAEDRKDRKEEAAKGATVAAAAKKVAGAPDEGGVAGASGSSSGSSSGPSEAASPTASDNTASGAMSGSMSESSTNGASRDGSAMVAAAPEAKLTPEDEEQARLREQRLYTDLEVQRLANLPPDQRFKNSGMWHLSRVHAFLYARNLAGLKREGKQFLSKHKSRGSGQRQLSARPPLAKLVTFQPSTERTTNESLHRNQNANQRHRGPAAGVSGVGLTLLQNTEARGYYENTTKGDYVVKLKGPYDIALNQQPDGTFGLTTDLWQGHVEQEVGKGYGKLLQLYGVHKASIEARKKGLSVLRRQQQNGAIKLVLMGA